MLNDCINAVTVPFVYLTVQQWILQEKQRLAAIREKGTLDSGVQTDIVPLPVLADVNENESSRETVRPSLIVGDRKRVVHEELLKHHALRRNENRIRRKRLRYQLERIARKRHLLEAKQELQRLEAALSLGVDSPQSPDLGSPSKRRERPMVLRRHSFSVDLLSRLYPQHTPIFRSVKVTLFGSVKRCSIKISIIQHLINVV